MRGDLEVAVLVMDLVISLGQVSEIFGRRLRMRAEGQMGLGQASSLP
jgi:hypothetical protein